MVHAFKKKVKVKPGGLIEVRSSEFIPGSTVEVIVLQEFEPKQEKSLLELFGAARGVFGSPSEADEYIRKERDSWDE